MNKKILKILSYILIIIGVLKTILCAIVIFIGTIVLVNKDYILSLDIYKNSLEYHKAIKELTDFDISEIELFGVSSLCVDPKYLYLMRQHVRLTQIPKYK